ncbi:MAG: acetolactate synthase, large subunit [Deinococcota bacterium]|jgi:acetolactate synthase I/II/III large subunit
MKVADYLGKYLEQQGVTHVFELVGGMITFMLDSIYQHTSIKIISMHHEQGAAFAAEGWARMKGLPGVAFATSGPGATNLLTSIGSCYFDSVPTVFITGQVNRHEQKGDKAIRQLGFQETDIISMVKPITKAAWQIQNPEDFPSMLHKAFMLALEGRPGPVLLDIPMDVQRVEIGEPGIPKLELKIQPFDLPERTEFLRQLGKALQQAKKPLILAGGGIRASRANKAFLEFAECIGVSVVYSLMGVDTIAYLHPLHVGMIGSYGNRWANLAIGESDLLIVLGSRLDVRQTGAMTKEFKGGKPIFHVDVQTAEMNNRVVGCETLTENLPSFLEAAIQTSAAWLENIDYSGWKQQLTNMQLEYADTLELKDITGINPNQFMHQLAQDSSLASAFIVDVGQHQMWAAQSLEIAAHQRFLTSGGMGSMGFALPAAIGAAFASQAPVVVIAGDGGFQCNIQELQTIVRNQLPMKLVVINNQTHGMVRQFQQSYFHGRYQSTLWGYDAPDFTRVAMAYGIEAQTISREEEIQTALEWLWIEPNKPQLLQIMIDTNTNVYPKIAFGQPITGMEPEYQPLEMEGT